eukprot:5326169-Pyramimonas_sp.AAC.1
MLLSVPKNLHNIVGAVDSPGPHSLMPLHFAAARPNMHQISMLTSTSKGMTVFFTAQAGCAP